MIVVFGHEHLGQEARAGPAALDRARGHRRWVHRLAAATGVLGPQVAHDAEGDLHVLQLLRRVFAQAREPSAAARAGAAVRRQGGLVDDVVAGKMVRQWAAHRLARRSFGPRRCRRGDALFQVFELQLELVDPGQLLGRGAVGLALQPGEFDLELLDQEHGADEPGLGLQQLLTRRLQRRRLVQRPRLSLTEQAFSLLPCPGAPLSAQADISREFTAI